MRFNVETSGFWLPRPFSHSDSSHSASRRCIQLAAMGSCDFDPHSHVPFRTFAEPVETLKATRREPEGSAAYSCRRETQISPHFPQLFPPTSKAALWTSIAGLTCRAGRRVCSPGRRAECNNSLCDGWKTLWAPVFMSAWLWVPASVIELCKK